MAAEVGVAYLSVVPSFKGTKNSLERQLTAAGGPAADSAGRTMGERLQAAMGPAADRTGTSAGGRIIGAMRKAMGKQKLTAKDLGLDNLRASVTSAERAITKATEEGAAKQAAAKRKVAIAQAQLTEANQKYTRGSSQVLRAQDNLVKAHGTLSAAQRSAATEQTKLADNLRSSRRELRETSIAARTAAQDTERSFGAKWSNRISTAMRSAFKDPKVVALAGVAGVLAGRAWARNFENASKKAKAPNPLVGLIGKASGLRAVTDFGQSMRDVFSNMDRYAVSAATLGLKIGGLSSVLIGATGVMLSFGAGLKTMLGAGLALPAVFAGVAAGMYVFNTALADFATVLPDVTADYTALNGVVSDNFWARAAGPMREAAYELLPVLRAGLTGVSHEFGGWAVAVSNAVSSASGLASIAYIFENIRRAADVMGDGIAAAVDGLLLLTATGSTLLPRLAGAFNQVAWAFQNWAQVNTANGNILRWIDEGITQMKLFGSTVGSVLGIFGALQQANVAGGGAKGFEAIAAGAAAVNAALRTPLWQGALTTMFRGAYDSMALITNGLKSMLPDLAAFMPTFAEIMRLSGETIGAMIASLGDLLSHPAVQGGLVSFFTAVRDATTLLAPSAGLVGDAFGAIAETAGALFFAVSGTLDAALRAVAPAFLAISQNTQQLIPGLSTIAQTIIQGAAPGFMILGTAIGAIVGIVARAVGFLSQFGGLWKYVGVVLVSVGAGLGVLAIASRATTIAMGILRGAVLFLNAALMMNPVAIVVAALVALGVAVYAAYQNIGWFKTGVQVAWMGIRIAVQAVVGWFQSVVVPALSAALRAVGGFFTWLYQSAVRPAFAWIRGAVANTVAWFQTTALPFLRSAIQALGSVFTWLYRNVVMPAWTGIRIVVVAVAAVLTTIFQGIVWLVRNVLGPVFTWLYQNIVRPVLGWIVNAVRSWASGVQDNFRLVHAFIKNVLGPVVMWLWRNIFAPALRAIGRSVSAAWTGVIRPTFEALKQGVTWVGDRLRNLRDRTSTIMGQIRETFASGWRFIRDRVFNPLKQGLSWVGDRTASVRSRMAEIWRDLRQKMYDGANAIKSRTLDPLKQALSWLGDRAASVRSRIAEIWMNLRQRLYDGAEAIKAKTFDPLKRALDRVKEAFKTGVDGIGRAWDGLKEKMKEPVRVVINKVINDGFIDNFRKIGKTFGLKEEQLPKRLSLPAGFRGGGYTGNRPKDEVAGVVHGRENVTGAESSASIERAAPGYMDRLNRYGASALGSEHSGHSHGAYAVGDRVYGTAPSFTNGLQHAVARTGELNVTGNPSSVWQLNAAIRMMDKATSIDVKRGVRRPRLNSNGVHVDSGRFSSMPSWAAGYYSGNSIQLQNGSVSGTGARTVTAHEIGHALGLPHAMPSEGGNGARSIMNYDNQFQHNSVTSADVAALKKIYGGGGVAGGGSATDESEGGLMGRLLELIGFDKLLGKIPGSTFVVDLFKGAMSKLWEGFKGWAGGLIGGGSDDEVATTQDVEKWRDEVISALKREGLPSNKTWQDAWLRQIKSESGGNPNAVQQVKDVNTGGNEAVGLVQVAKGTFDSYRNPSLPNNRKDPAASLSAGMRWAKSRYGIDRMLDVIGHGHGYSKAPRFLHDQGGLIQPGISMIENRTRKPEQSLNPAQTRAWLKNTELVDTLAQAGNAGTKIEVNVAARADEDPSRLGARISERIAFELQDVMM